MILTNKLNELNSDLLTEQNKLKFKRIRGMNKGRKQAMKKANKESYQNIVRLCNSVYRNGLKCKFGTKCNALHSLSKYWEQRSSDLGCFVCFFFTKILY